METYYEISKPEVLKRELEKCKNIFATNVYDFFESLILLKKSVFTGNFNEYEYEIISRLPFYKSVVKYNIYSYALNFLKDNNIQMYQNIDYRNCKIDMFSNLKLKNSPRTINVFSLSINKNNDVELQLFNSKSDNFARERELIKLKKNISDIGERQSKIGRKISIGKGYDFEDWPIFKYNFDDCDYEDQLSMYKNAIKKINSRVSLSKNDQEEIDISNQIYNSLLKIYSIDDDFNYDKTEYIKGASHKYMNKIKIKNKNGIKVISNNYYL